jgi:hypothetical protein
MDKAWVRFGWAAALAALVVTTGTPPVAAGSARRKPAPRKPAAKKPAAARPSLTAEQILTRHVDATGGREAYLRQRSVHAKGTLEMSAAGLRGTFEVKQKAPDRLWLLQNLAGFGEATQAYDGKTGWSKDPLNGLRELSGAELALVQRSARLHAPLEWKTLYKKVELLGIRPVEGKDAYAVRLAPEVGQPTTQFFDARSFLLVRQDTIVEGPTGVVPTESYPSDYRDVEGVKTAFKTRQRIGGGAAEIVMTITEIKVNVEIDDAIFAKPAANPPAP